ncbi:hypothetical protein SAMN05216421_1213 [Halopseudomonas xinjiangensis]|uniref:CrfX protein n=1 Tax=Halopseudomonas xinjiangensis TaxID=487184 RepID=A0A1H1QVP7_9GAMM|nr:hypothetical protein [Halopseudomonas xinjiangensis]SDS26939.1 hypothetical protein SAMN05216421_1213 [Halopseudomonas xinjiangensis]
MSDPLEDRLRSLMRADQQNVGQDDQRLERVLHKAHVRGGVLDLLTLFSRWGVVLSEAGTHHSRNSLGRNASEDETATTTERKD